jgi:luciferase family oxidoreductase group 1
MIIFGCRRGEENSRFSTSRPVIAGLSARAIEETITLARRADELGYHRYWLAEHHAIAALADPCPEVLVARLGAETRRIRVGTGGVLLPYYSAFRTAETFRMLEALYPGRIDLGIGRAPGGDARTAQAVGGVGFVVALPQRVAEPRRCWKRGYPESSWRRRLAEVETIRVHMAPPTSTRARRRVTCRSPSPTSSTRAAAT